MTDGPSLFAWLYVLLPSLIALATLRVPHIAITAFLVGIGCSAANNGWAGLGTLLWAVALVVSLSAISSAARIGSEKQMLREVQKADRLAELSWRDRQNRQ